MGHLRLSLIHYLLELTAVCCFIINCSQVFKQLHGHRLAHSTVWYTKRAMHGSHGQKCKDKPSPEEKSTVHSVRLHVFRTSITL